MDTAARLSSIVHPVIEEEEAREFTLRTKKPSAVGKTKSVPLPRHGFPSTNFSLSKEKPPHCAKFMERKHE